MVLDVFDLCTEELQTKLVPMRTKFKEEEDRLVELQKDVKTKGQTAEKKTEKQPFSFPDGEKLYRYGMHRTKLISEHSVHQSIADLMLI